MLYYRVGAISSGGLCPSCKIQRGDYVPVVKLMGGGGGGGVGLCPHIQK